MRRPGRPRRRQVQDRGSTLPTIEGRGRSKAGPGPTPLGLIGRTRECQAVEDVLVRMRDGHSAVLVVRGDAGIGKTALLRHLVDAAAGFRVVHATGVESEMELPFAGLHQLCGSMVEHLG